MAHIILPPSRYNLSSCEAAVARCEAALAAFLQERWPADAAVEYVAAWDRHRANLRTAQADLAAARSRSRFVLKNWDGSRDPCWLLGLQGDVATVRFDDGSIQTMDRTHFFESVA